MQRQLHLFGDAADPAERSAPTAGIGEATNLAAWIESTNTSDDALAYLAQAAVSLAERHPVLAPADALRWVLGLHERVQGLLQGKQRLRQRRELFGIQSGLLAHVCLLLGDLQQADTAGRYGDLAELAATEGGLSPAPAFSARAQVARWQNRYADAAVLAAAGSDSCNSPSLRALLACQEANAAALAGDRQRARAALERAAAGLCPATESAWSLPGPRFVAYRVSVALHLGDPASALREAEAAERPRSRPRGLTCGFHLHSPTSCSGRPRERHGRLSRCSACRASIGSQPSSATWRQRINSCAAGDSGARRSQRRCGSRYGYTRQAPWLAGAGAP